MYDSTYVIINAKGGFSRRNGTDSDATTAASLILCVLGTAARAAAATSVYAAPGVAGPHM